MIGKSFKYLLIINSDDPSILFVDPYNVLCGHIYDYCENNPVMFVDKDVDIAANVIGAVIGAVVGAVGGYFLTNWLADKIGLRGWKRKVFVWGLSAVITASASAIGYFIGPYVAKVVRKLSSYTVDLIKRGKVSISRFSLKVRNALNLTDSIVNELIKKAGSLKRSKTVLKNLKSRPYINSTLTIRNIMKSAKPVVDKSLKNGLKWVRGRYNGRYGTWELVIDITTKTIVHFLFKT